LLVVACYAIKGGVGKTSTAVNLGYLSAAHGDRTLLWDLDPQASATYLFRVKPKVRGGAAGLVRRRHQLDDAVKATDYDNLDLLPADFSYRNLDLALDATKRPTRQIGELLEPLADSYDHVILDCPPSVSLLSESVIRAADVVAVPIVPSSLSLRSFDQLLAHLVEHSKKQPRVVGFFSMVDRRKREHRDAVAALPAQRAEILPLAVPVASVVEQMGWRRAPVETFAPSSEAADAYRRLWAAVRAASSPPETRR
jgi:chromosome partitioning protein